MKLLLFVGKYVTGSAVYNTVDGRKRFYERKVREREIEGERKGCYNKFIQDPDPDPDLGSDPKLSEKLDLDPGSDPKKIIPDPQHCLLESTRFTMELWKLILDRESSP